MKKIVFLYLILYSTLGVSSISLRQMRDIPLELRILASTENYQVVKALAKGAYGQVWLVRDLKTDSEEKQLLAIKIMDLFQENGNIHHNNIRELAILQKLVGHPSFVQMLDFHIVEDKILLVMKYYPKNLFEYIKTDLQDPILSPSEQEIKIKEIFAKILVGLEHLWNNVGCINRDLKPQNILMDAFSNPHIADFGLAKMLASSYRVQTPSNRIVTLWYRSPDLILGSSSAHDLNIDLWSLGCILGEMKLGKPLFTGRTEEQQAYCYFRQFGVPSEHHLPELSKLPYTAGLGSQFIAAGGPSTKSESSINIFADKRMNQVVNKLLSPTPFLRGPVAEIKELLDISPRSRLIYTRFLQLLDSSRERFEYAGEPHLWPYTAFDQPEELELKKESYFNHMHWLKADQGIFNISDLSYHTAIKMMVHLLNDPRQKEINLDNLVHYVAVAAMIASSYHENKAIDLKHLAQLMKVELNYFKSIVVDILQKLKSKKVFPNKQLSYLQIKEFYQQNAFVEEEKVAIYILDLLSFIPPMESLSDAEIVGSIIELAREVELSSGEIEQLKADVQVIELAKHLSPLLEAYDNSKDPIYSDGVSSSRFIKRKLELHKKLQKTVRFLLKK